MVEFRAGCDDDDAQLGRGIGNGGHAARVRVRRPRELLDCCVPAGRELGDGGLSRSIRHGGGVCGTAGASCWFRLGASLATKRRLR